MLEFFEKFDKDDNISQFSQKRLIFPIDFQSLKTNLRIRL